MTYTQKAVGILIGFVLLLVLFWLIVYIPKSNKLDGLQLEAQEIDLKIVKMENSPD